MSQSSIEYLMEMIRLNGKDFYAMLLDDKVFEKAKEMHKDEIKIAHSSGRLDRHNDFSRTPEQYYNETYGGNNEQ